MTLPNYQPKLNVKFHFSQFSEISPVKLCTSHSDSQFIATHPELPSTMGSSPFNNFSPPRPLFPFFAFQVIPKLLCSSSSPFVQIPLIHNHRLPTSNLPTHHPPPPPAAPPPTTNQFPQQQLPNQTFPPLLHMKNANAPPPSQKADMQKIKPFSDPNTPKYLLQGTIEKETVSGSGSVGGE